MLEEVLRFTKEHRMIEEGDRVIAGVSGGADSVCLLLLLQRMQREIDFSLRVIHVEHGIRGEESVQDAAFVEALCKKAGIDCQCFFVDVPKVAKEEKCTLEEAARNLRYGILEREAKAWGGAKIAVAHNRQDDAETVLFHLTRGSGLYGLRGILPVRGNIIRPLLHTDREAILAYLEEEGQEYRTDSTNGDVRYSRNKIRSQVLPELREINPRVCAHIQGTADFIKDTLSYLGRQAELAEKSCAVRGEDEIKIEKEAFFQYDSVIRGEVLRRALYALTDSRKDMEQVHFHMMEELFLKQAGRRIALPYGMEAYRSYDGIAIRRQKEEQEGLEAFCLSKEELERAGMEGIHCGPFTVRLLENQGDLEKIPQKTYTKWFDYDKIKSNLLARSRREGDYFLCDDAGHTQKLKRYFVNEKIEAGKRDKIWLLAEDSHILWMVGYRISTYYKIQKETKRILEVQFDGGKEND